MGRKTKKVISPIAYLFLFLICSISSILLMSNAFIKKNVEIKFSERTSNNYEVCVKKNEFYKEECIAEGKQYVASLIDHINLRFKYSFKADTSLDYTYSYSLNGRLVIYDKNNDKNELYSEVYELVPLKNNQKKDSYNLNIDEYVEVEYTKYNNLATTFKKQFNVTGESKFVISFTINVVGTGVDGVEYINRVVPLSIVVPLTENTINITVDSKNNLVEDTIKNEEKIKNNLLFIAGIIMCFMSLISLYMMIFRIYKKRKKTSKYDKFIKKLRNEYGRYIVDSETMIDENDYKQVFDVANFEELLDKARIRDDNIICTEDVIGRKTWFCIIQDDYLYRRVYSENDEVFR